MVESYIPSHKDFRVHFRPGEHRSSLKSLKAFKPGEVMTYLRGLTKGTRDYTTVQNGCGHEDNIKLNSDLVFINHSCEPNATFDMSFPDRSKWQLRALKDIYPGDEVTFFYPSTEWDMDQPFKCHCGKATCLGMVKGAKYLSKAAVLAREFVNAWILQLLDERDGNSPLHTRPVSRL